MTPENSAFTLRSVYCGKVWQLPPLSNNLLLTMLTTVIVGKLLDIIKTKHFWSYATI